LNSSVNYRLSFTGASFRLYESIALAKFYFEYGSWETARKHFIESSTSRQSRATVVRESREIIIRLQNLSDPMLEKMTTAEPDDAKMVLFYSILKTYPMIREFCNEVLYEKLLLMDMVLQEYEVNAFIRKLEERYDFFEEKSDTTKNKLKQVMIKIFADAGILRSTKDWTMIKPYIDTEIVKLIVEDGGAGLLKPMLMTEKEIAASGVIA